MAQSNSRDTIDLIIQNEAIHLREIPDHLLDAWIIGIANKPDYNYERDFIINIFNELYEGHIESHNLNMSDHDSRVEEYRLHFERLLRAEKERRSTSQDPRDFG